MNLYRTSTKQNHGNIASTHRQAAQLVLGQQAVRGGNLQKGVGFLGVAHTRAHLRGQNVGRSE